MTSLGDKAEAFADEVATTISAALGIRPRIIAEALDDRFVVRTVDRGVQLRVDSASIMALACRWECELDHRGEYLSVSRSEFRVFVEGDRVPVFRASEAASLRGARCTRRSSGRIASPRIRGDRSRRRHSA